MTAPVSVFLPGPGEHTDRRSLVGSPAPTFQTRDEAGNAVTLGRMLRAGPLLIHFYRGHW